MSNSNGIFNVKDYGAKGSVISTRVRSFAGSDYLETDDTCDFAVGDEVQLVGCKQRNVYGLIYVRMDVSPVNPRPTKRPYPITDEFVFSGYDGSDGELINYIIDICPEFPGILRYTKDYGRTWVDNVPIVNGKAELDLGRTLTVGDFEDLQYGVTVIFTLTSRSVIEVVGIEGNKIRVSTPLEYSGEGELLHSDSAGIQRAVGAAKEVSGTVYFPRGNYRLTNSILIEDAKCISFEGESADGVVLSVMEGHRDTKGILGSCFYIKNSKSVSIKNFSMVGGMGFAERDMAGKIITRGVEPSKVYGFYFAKTNALFANGVEKLYVENCHARRMSAECFYVSGPGRTSESEPELYQKSVIYYRCSVEDCARNAFNNNDLGENTSVLNCRIVDVGGCAWEGSSRFVKFSGNYIRNAGPVAAGNLRKRAKENELLGTGQHVISDNFFEMGVPYGGGAIGVGAGASQVIIKNNNFINFNSTAIRTMGTTQHSDLPPENMIITGNTIDLTVVGGEPKTLNEFLPHQPYSEQRMGIFCESSYVTISDNHIYVRSAECDNTAVGIYTSRVANHINIHDNIISRLGSGIKIGKAVGKVGLVVDDMHFYRYEPSFGYSAAPPIPRRFSDRLANRKVVFASGERADIAFCDPETKLITLKAPAKFSEGEEFVYYPEFPIFKLHDNIITNCEEAITGETFGIINQNNVIN